MLTGPVDGEMGSTVSGIATEATEAIVDTVLWDWVSGILVG